MKPRIVFMGSPDFAVPALRALAIQYPIVGVVTQPDRPSGRGREPAPPPVKRATQELGLALMQPPRVSRPEALEQLHAWSPDLIIVVAFGQILKPAVLDLPRFGCINVHASLLPRWRGAAPINAAILHGDADTGVTIMRLDPGVDTGPLLSRRSVPITAADTAGALSMRLAELGAGLLLETLPPYLAGELLPTPQDEMLATYAPMLSKADGALDFTCPAVELERRIRALNPWPGAYLLWPGGLLKVHLAHVHPGAVGSPGTRCIVSGTPGVHTAEGILVLDEVQPAGKKAMPGKVFLQGARGWT